MEVFIGSVVAFGFNFAPRGWQLCNGQLLSVTENTALFALLGTTYGGNGQTTFGVPNLQGRVPVAQGNSFFGSYEMGETAGNNQVTLTSLNLPMHNHIGTNPVAIPAVSSPANGSNPELARLANSSVNMYTASATDSSMRPFNAPVTVSVTGGNQPIDVTDPYLAINYSIATEGIFPSRD